MTKNKMSRFDKGLDDFYVNEIARLLNRIDGDEVEIRFWEAKRKELRQCKQK